MKKLLLTLSLFLSIGVFAQSNLDRADAEFENLNYSVAAKEYAAFLEEEQGDAYATLRLAICYKMMNDATKAAHYFEKAIYASDSEPISKYFYASTLMQLGQYEKAKKFYKEYKNWFPEDKKADLGIKACDEAMSIKSRPALYTVSNLKEINSKSNEFSASLKDSVLFFSSDRNAAFKVDYEYGWTGEGFLDNYSAKWKDGEFGSAKMTNFKENSLYHDATVSYSPNGKVMAFSRNQFKSNIFGGTVKKSSDDEVVKLKIMMRELEENGKWSAPFEASFNTPEFSFTHPTFSNDGKTLYFVSDMPGGYGGTDIWMAKLTEDLIFEKPVNLGSGVNTSADEMYPFIAADGSLYFSSNGHPGLGGLDVFRIEQGSNNLFSAPYNLGSPLNSSRDDFAYTMYDETHGYVSSNREGGLGGDDIYSTTLTGLFGKINVVNAITNMMVSEAEICVMENGVEKYRLKTNQNGVAFIPFSVNQRYELYECTEDFRSENLLINTFGKKTGTWVEETLKVYPKFRSHVSGYVLEQKSQLPLQGAKVTLINGNTGETETVDVDDFGFFKLEIFPAVDQYILYAEKEGYDKDELKFNTRDMVKEENRRMNLVLSGGEVICKLPFRNIYFDYNSAKIRGEASEDLNRMLDILNSSAQLRVQIAAHTDSRGTDEYNLSLSSKRAKSVEKWLIEKGVDRLRLNSKGYGEFELTNKCENEVECTEEEHQQNRRVEFKVIDEDGKVICKSTK